jgi:succinate dehydrogenase / fumarate reductase cytochrome b subunit
LQDNIGWKRYFSTSIGRKLQMAFTGLFLIMFLIVHCYINAQIFWNDAGIKFNEIAHFMGTNFLIRFTELGLFAFLLLHIIQGLSLWKSNRSKRSIRNTIRSGSTSTPWYRRSMGLLGTLILIFLIIHLSAFWGPNRFAQTFGKGEINLYEKMKGTFTSLWVVIVYVLGCISLGWHLVHGFWSSFNTLGLATHRYKRIINKIGVVFSIVIPLIFALMPLSFYFGWIR